MIHLVISLIASKTLLLTRAFMMGAILMPALGVSANDQQAHQEPTTKQAPALPSTLIPTPFWLNPQPAPPSHPCHTATTPGERLNATPSPMRPALTTESCLTQHRLEPLENTTNIPETLPDIFAEEARKSEEASPISVGGKIELNEESPEVEITGGQVTIDIKTQ